jgi:hypothetical protein
MTSITTRAGKGSPLTHNEVDANFTNLDNDKLDTAGVALGSAASPTLKFTGDANTGIYSPGADQLAVSTGGTGRLFVDASGNVGIGTSSPSSPLTVNGKTTLVGPEDGQLEWSLGGQAWRANIQSGGKWYLYDATNVKFPLEVAPNSTCKIDINTSHLAFNTGSSERVRIDSSGNVGIGTSSPSDILSAQKSDTSNSLFDSDAAITITNSESSAFGRTTNLNFNQGSDGVAQRIGSIAGIYTNNTSSVGGALAFLTNNGSGTVGERLRITSAGNVGIGTTSPTTLLDVNADTVRVRTARTPASAAATGAVGEICWDANYIYVCTATNTWKRSALSTW